MLELLDIKDHYC